MMKLIIKMLNFETSFDSLLHKKNAFVDLAKSAIQKCLSEETESNKIFHAVVQILNTEGWERERKYKGNTYVNLELAGAHIEYLFEHFKTPLTAAEVNASSADLLMQWHELLQYSKVFLSISVAHYMKTCRIFNSSRCSAWKERHFNSSGTFIHYSC